MESLPLDHVELRCLQLNLYIQQQAGGLISKPQLTYFEFQLDVGTVYAQVDHRFCRRWAVLTDPEETLGASGAGVKV